MSGRAWLRPLRGLLKEEKAGAVEVRASGGGDHWGSGNSGASAEGLRPCAYSGVVVVVPSERPGHR